MEASQDFRLAFQLLLFLLRESSLLGKFILDSLLEYILIYNIVGEVLTVLVLTEYGPESH